jgi:fibronectin-binding autotransporter adhesin
MVSRPRAGRLLVCVWWIATASGAAPLLWYTGTGTGSTNRSITSNSFVNVRIVANNTALGSTAAGTTVSNTAALQFDGSGGNLTVGEALTFNTTNTNGGLRNLAGTNTLTGLVTLQANLDYRHNGGRLVVDGGITTANNSGISFNGAATIQTVAASLGTGILAATSSNNEAAAVRIDVAGNTWSLARINFGGYVRTGVDNALPASAGVEFGWSTDDF